ncbi:hypothetical protein E2562_036896 [Oryza meyeriana var. granulata]|uniref:Uncharacterized protein n=1 Tax=Oryza meyeriana var. granulata TaxID=110450 RepID=A0A6G1ETF7_9ORYZ|nr:hypothetical protein E2562_036896 [Oryza meyeriana var. granulata]
MEPGMARRLWHVVLAVCHMLRRGLCRKRVMMDLHVLLGRGKLAGRALRGLLAHHAAAGHGGHHHLAAYGTPSVQGPGWTTATPSPMLAWILGRSPAGVRPLRVTDSPFPAVPEDGGGEQRVDAEFEDFINKQEN